jgi:hypothetical protein
MNGEVVRIWWSDYRRSKHNDVSAQFQLAQSFVQRRTAFRVCRVCASTSPSSRVHIAEKEKHVHGK